ncbi:hypothetical protein QOT17_012531 [Balamuthia mandrillaris]
MGLSKCNCFYGFWYSFSLPATVWNKFWMPCGGADRDPGLVCLRATMWLVLIAWWLCIVCFVLILVGLIMDVICCVIWLVTLGFCFTNCSPAEQCCQATGDTEPFECLV